MADPYVIAVIVAVSFLLINLIFAVSVLGFHFLRRKKRKIQPEAAARRSKNGDLFCIWEYDGRIAYEDIIQATEKSFTYL